MACSRAPLMRHRGVPLTTSAWIALRILSRAEGEAFDDTLPRPSVPGAGIGMLVRRGTGCCATRGDF